MDDRMKLKIAYLAIAGVGLALLTAMSSCSNQSMASDKKITCTPDSFMLLPDSSNQGCTQPSGSYPEALFLEEKPSLRNTRIDRQRQHRAKYKPIVLDAPIYSRKMET